MFTKSIRWRLQLWMAFLLVCVLSGFGVTVYQLQRINQMNQLDEELERLLSALSSNLREGPFPDSGPMGPGPGRGAFPSGREPEGFGHGMRPPPPDGRNPGLTSMRFPFNPEKREFRLSAMNARLFDEHSTNGFYYAVWLRGVELPKRSTNGPALNSAPMQFNRDTRTHLRTRGIYREAFHFTELGDCVLAGQSMIMELSAQKRLAWILFGAGGSVLAIGLGGGYWLASRSIRPIEEISASAKRISAGNLAERIPVADGENELGRLAGVLNSTFARLESAFDEQKQFTADASHELRTPLSVIISETQTTLSRERTAAEYRETIETCLETAQQMRRLTEMLLTLARFDAEKDQLEKQPVDLAEVADDCVHLIRPLATQAQVQIHTELRPAQTFGDAERLRQVMTNLLTNAIHYNKPGGEIHVTTSSENQKMILTVSDTGQGIAAEDLPHVFKRFYRADKSRTRASGRTGLGLAISKAVIDAHSGAVEVSSRVGEGTTFTVTLPA